VSGIDIPEVNVDFESWDVGSKGEARSNLPLERSLNRIVFDILPNRSASAHAETNDALVDPLDFAEIEEIASGIGKSPRTAAPPSTLAKCDTHSHTSREKNKIFSLFLQIFFTFFLYFAFHPLSLSPRAPKDPRNLCPLCPRALHLPLPAHPLRLGLRQPHLRGRRLCARPLRLLH